MKRSVRIATVGAAVAVVAAGAVLSASTAREPPPLTSPGSWYPSKNAFGAPAVADFEGHVPCTIDPEPEPGCERVKLGLVLYGDASTGEPRTYLMSIVRVGVSDDREVHHGDLHIESGTALDPAATVYRLEGAPEHLGSYWAVSEDLLLMIDQDRMPRVGDARYSYTLNGIPLRQERAG